MLEKSMQRIKIPQSFINLSKNILININCQIITNNGFTNQILIPDGIDQGETLSPLWWIIFYDPLITTLEKSKPLFNQFTNTLAYMDNLNLIAPTKNNLQSQ